ncbi:hypothetical protein CRE_00364 [Caenorhabditis remanei]|uniref:Uncharacterized protein n=1 Tax=Caenorhabditis remanei TaxID=31234 RepID=E3LER4_CAERE|nr:hypothetical protein CRE_00364 [Caenorhabditis remanei]
MGTAFFGDGSLADGLAPASGSFLFNTGVFFSGSAGFFTSSVGVSSSSHGGFHFFAGFLIGVGGTSGVFGSAFTGAAFLGDGSRFFAGTFAGSGSLTVTDFLGGASAGLAPAGMGSFLLRIGVFFSGAAGCFTSSTGASSSSHGGFHFLTGFLTGVGGTSGSVFAGTAFFGDGSLVGLAAVVGSFFLSAGTFRAVGSGSFTSSVGVSSSSHGGFHFFAGFLIGVGGTTGSGSFLAAAFFGDGSLGFTVVGSFFFKTGVFFSGTTGASFTSSTSASSSSHGGFHFLTGFLTGVGGTTVVESGSFSGSFLAATAFFGEGSLGFAAIFFGDRSLTFLAGSLGASSIGSSSSHGGFHFFTGFFTGADDGAPGEGSGLLGASFRFRLGFFSNFDGGTSSTVSTSISSTSSSSTLSHGGFHFFAGFLIGVGGARLIMF